MPDAPGTRATPSRQEQFNECATTFLARDYPAVCEQALVMVSDGFITPGLLQMLVIAAQRSGQADLVRGIAEQTPRITETVPWEHTLLNVTLGETHPDQALSLAADNEQRAQVLFYAAARLITQGQAALAPDLLWESLALCSRGFESILATAELTWIEQASTVNSGPEGFAGDQIAASSDRARTHFDRGDLRGAPSVHQQAGELQPALERVIRVFVSSTFADMQEERDGLVKRIFPALRDLCESRGVTWGEVDLRWGITDEQVDEGEALPICLEEVRECRPYFIGLLGERYGWVPDEIDASLIEQEPWLAEHAGSSVTEFEIIQGVLADPAMAVHAFFYFRDPAYAQHGPAFGWEPAAEEVQNDGSGRAWARARLHHAKLADLKDRIRQSGLPVRENYADPRVLGELVLEDMTAVIERLFPAGSAPSPLDRERGLHQGFARRLAGVYIPRRAYFDQLDRHVDADGEPLVVSGEPGVGKSALLANWALGLEQRRERGTVPGEAGTAPLIMHFVGASAESADWIATLRRIIEELDGTDGTSLGRETIDPAEQQRMMKYFGQSREIPDDPIGLRRAFADAVHRAAARGRIVLVIDALDQLDDQDGAPDLLWLPPTIPENVRLVLSTRPGRPLDELHRRGWPLLEVLPLDEREREQLIVEYLEQYQKRLPDREAREVASAPQSANPLFLCTMLSELRLYGHHETLANRLHELLAAPDASRLYDLILTRWEQDYERDRPGLVRDAMTLLWAARRGLSETELLELVGEKAAPSTARDSADGESGKHAGAGEDLQRLPHAVWAPLYLAAKQALISRSGLLGFAHEDARIAVERRYLPREDDQCLAHSRLARYFAKSDENTARKLEEFPWQLARARQWPELRETLADTAFMTELAWSTPTELRSYWAQLEAESPYRLIDTYAAMIADPDQHDPRDVEALARLLYATGHSEPALAAYQGFERICRRLGDSDGIARSLSTQAGILEHDDQDSALEVMNELERLCREVGDWYWLAWSLSHQAGILIAHGDLNGALARLREAERFFLEHRHPDEVVISQGGQEGYLHLRGDIDGAIEGMKQQDQIALKPDIDGALTVLKEQERIAIELAQPDLLFSSLGGQAVLLEERGDLDGALALHKHAERLFRELGEPTGVAASLGSQAAIFQARGDLDGALALIKEQEQTCRNVGYTDGLVSALGHHAAILEERGDSDGVLAILKEQERIYRELGDDRLLAESLVNEAVILQAHGDPDGALALHIEAERICRQAGNNDVLARSLAYHAVILEEREDLDGALKLAKEQEQICRELPEIAGLLNSLSTQALILRAQGNLDGALERMKEHERICREHGLTDQLAGSLGNQAVMLKERGNLDDALRMHKEEEHAYRELGDPHGLSRSLGNQAGILLRQGHMNDALALCREQERICREAGYAGGIAISLSNQAMVLRARGDLDGALALHKQTERIYREVGDTFGLANSLGNQAMLFAQQGDLQAAVERARPALQLAEKYGYADLAQTIVEYITRH